MLQNNNEGKKEIIDQLKKLRKKSEINRQAYSIQYSRYAKIAKLLHAFILVSSCVTATLIFTDYTVFKPIVHNLTEDVYKLVNGGIATLVFVLTIIEESFKPGNIAKEYDVAIKRYTEFIRNINYVVNTKNADDKEVRKIIDKYNFICELSPQIPDRIFVKAKKKLLRKIEISKALDRDPFKCVLILKIKKKFKAVCK